VTEQDFAAFTKYLMGVCPRADWPKSQEWWVLLKGQLDLNGIALPIAKEAAKVMALKAAPFVSDVLPNLLESARILRDQLQAATVYGAEINREDAEKESRRCVECGGYGITSREIEWERRGEVVKTFVGFYCNRCKMGRWVKRQHEIDNDNPGNRLRDLGDHPELWRKHETPDEMLDPGEAARLIREMTTKAAAEMKIKRPHQEIADAARAAWEKRRKQTEEATSWA
jgi:hypothetical protein